MATAVRAMSRLGSANQWSSITPLRDIPKWYELAIQTVKRLAAQAENWDGYGSLNIQVPARTAANELLSILIVNSACPPHIAPVPSGGLQFEWTCDDRLLELEILPTGSMEFLTASSEGEMLEGIVSDPKRQVPWLLEWLRLGEVISPWTSLESGYATQP